MNLLPVESLITLLLLSMSAQPHIRDWSSLPPNSRSSLYGRNPLCVVYFFGNLSSVSITREVPAEEPPLMRIWGSSVILGGAPHLLLVASHCCNHILRLLS